MTLNAFIAISRAANAKAVAIHALPFGGWQPVAKAQSAEAMCMDAYASENGVDDIPDGWMETLELDYLFETAVICAVKDGKVIGAWSLTGRWFIGSKAVTVDEAYQSTYC